MGFFMFAMQLAVVALAIIVGARLSGVGLGMMGGLGLAVLTFVFGLKPTAPPIDVMLMILAVITAAAAMQTAGGLDYLVRMAERILRRNPSRVTFLGPLVTYVFTLFAGTGHVAYSVLPVIAQVARESGVRPERPLSIAVIASQQAIVASPISAATVALLGMLSGQGFELVDILKISLPATFCGCLIGAAVVNRMGRELADDPEYRRRLDAGLITETGVAEQVQLPAGARLSVWIFLAAALAVVLVGTFPELRPAWPTLDGGSDRLSMALAIEMIMLSAAGLIVLACRVEVGRVAQGSVFQAGAAAVIAIFGIAWMGDTFFHAHMDYLSASVQGLVTQAPWLFALALFMMSVLLNSQAATVRALVPLGMGLGLPGASLIAMFPAVNGYFFIPNYPPLIAAINFDTTGTTRIGRWLLNHSFMVPGLVATWSAVAIGWLLVML